MDVFQHSSQIHEASPEAAPIAGFGQIQAAAYGSLGPGSDIADAVATSSQPKTKRSFGPALAVAIGVFLAGLVVGVDRPHAASHLWNTFSAHGTASAQSQAVAHDFRRLDYMQPQKQAETLLELAVSRSDRAADQISSRVDRWQGKLTWDSEIAALTSAALNSSDMRVRESGVEVELAAYGLNKNSSSVSHLLRAAESQDHAQKIWALWALGLIGNRQVETERVVQGLAAHLKDSDEDVRRWTVEGLALTGTSEAMKLLLQTMHDDPSPSVRERAACALAQSGMFTYEQRLSAVPQLLNYTSDSALSGDTHIWAFQALADITGQHLPNDSSAWRSWYEEKVASGQ